jgi:hypothetical protein
MGTGLALFDGQHRLGVGRKQAARRRGVVARYREGIVVGGV